MKNQRRKNVGDLEKNQIEIEEEVEQEENNEDFDIEGLSNGELELAKESGLYKELEENENADNKQSETKTEEDNEDDSKEKEKEINKDPDNFEEMENVLNKDEKKFHETFTPNQKALYFKAKVEKKKRQEIKKENEELNKKIKELQSSSGSKKKLDKIKELLENNSDSLTIEQLQAIISTKEEIEEKIELNEDKTKETIASRIVLAEQIGKGQYNNFNNICNLAGEIFKSKPRYQKQFDEMVADSNIDETEIVDFVVDIAKLNKDYGKEKVSQEAKEKVNRVLKNSKKKISSASIGGSSGKRIISEDELTCAQVQYKAKTLSSEEYNKFWEKLSEKTKTRLLKGIDPE